MATSTNYGWAEPDNSSLVKNGAQDIRTLGNAIDTSVWNVGFGQAGKNKIINGNFGVWQRGTTFTAYGSYWADRWTSTGDRTSPSFTQQTFTPATAPVAGYEGQYYARWVPGSGGTFSNMQQRIEDVRTFANQGVTLSYWAKISTGTATNSPFIIQNFGSGGSAEVSTALTTNTITTTWTRFTHSFTVPSISGKTLGASSYLSILPLRFETASTANVDVWGVQLEYGSTATPFQTASGGSPQAELAMCQRYYWRWNANTNFATCGIGAASSTTTGVITVMHPVPMRTVVSAIDGSANSTFRLQDQVTGLTQTAASIEVSQQDLYKTDINVTVSGATQYRFYRYGANNSTSAYLGFSAEL
jgi:hypothetical protein